MIDISKSRASVNLIQPDYFFAIPKINEILFSEISDIIRPNSKCFKDYQHFTEQIANQCILNLKDNILSFTLVHEYQLAKEAGILEGENEKDRFLSYIKLTNSEEWLEYLFEKYPKLEPKIKAFITNFLNYFQFVIEKLSEDFSSFERVFRLDSTIDNAQLFLGDFHCNNQFVLRFDFEDSSKLYFKPRDFRNEHFFENTVNFFNQFGMDISCNIPKNLGGDNYTWVEHLENKNHFQKESEVGSFYYNQGKLLFIFHLLGSVDIIPDNLIISNNLASYFDLECIVTVPRYQNKESIRYQFDESVMKTGMLPQWMMNNNFERDIISSTFFKFNSQAVTSKVWEKKAEHQYDYVEKRTTFSPDADKHLPILNGELIELNKVYLNKLLSGFNGAYDFALDNKSSILNYLTDNIANLRCKQRIILHPTAVYSLLLRELNIPEYLSGEKNIDAIISTLIDLDTTDNQIYDKDALLVSLKNQLRNLDVPYFFLNTEDGALYDGFNNLISDEWKFKPYEFLKSRLEDLSPKGKRFQSEIIEQTVKYAMEIKGFSMEENFIDDLHYKSNLTKLKVRTSHEIFKKTAIEIGYYLKDSSFNLEESLNWVSKVRDPADGRYIISLLNYDLYDGLSGIILFYLYLYKESGDLYFREDGLKLFKELEYVAYKRRESNFYSALGVKTLEKYPLSPYSYPMSYVYLATHIKANLGDEYVNYEVIHIIFDEIEEILELNKAYDYIIGSTGLLDSLLNFLKEFEQEELLFRIQILIDKCINHLKEGRNENGSQASWGFNDNGDMKEMGGFSHGTAGIATVLHKYCERYPEEKPGISDVFKKALNHDRSFFNAEINGWIDTRETEKASDSTAWCHGSTGIGLSRLLLKQNGYMDSKLRSELEIAKANIKRNGFLGNQSVCHGDFGNLEVLFALSNDLDPTYKDDIIHDYLGCLCQDYLKGKKFRSGDLGQMQLLGLFMGLSGMGYQLLRFSNWAEVPSILCLETPNAFNPVLHKEN